MNTRVDFRDTNPRYFRIQLQICYGDLPIIGVRERLQTPIATTLRVSTFSVVSRSQTIKFRKVFFVCINDDLLITRVGCPIHLHRSPSPIYV